MAFVAVPQGVQVEVRWTLLDQKCENRFFVNAKAPVTQEIVIAVADAVTAWVGTNYGHIVSSLVTFTEVVATDWSVPGGFQTAVPIAGAGILSENILPNEMSFCVSLRTGFRGRSARGRWFMPPPVAEQQLDSNHVTTAYITLAVGTMQALIDDLFDAGWRMAVASFVTDKVPNTPPVLHDYTVAIAVDNVLDSQRRRKPGNGS